MKKRLTLPATIYAASKCAVCCLLMGAWSSFLENLALASSEIYAAFYYREGKLTQQIEQATPDHKIHKIGQLGSVF